MFLTNRTNLLRNAFKAAVVALACGSSAISATAGTSRSEYEEWGLEQPRSGQVESSPEVEEEDLVDQFFSAVRENRQQPGANPVGVEIAADFEQAVVHVYAIMANGDKYRGIGWVIDAERGIVMTEFNQLHEAETIAVVFPHIPAPPGEKLGSVATLLPTNGDLGVTYLLIKKLPDQPLTALSVGHRHQTQRPVAPQSTQTTRNQQSPRNARNVRPAAPVNNPVCGRWILEHQGPGGQLHIEAVFNANGQFAMQVTTLDNHGNRTQESDQGQFAVQGSNLIVQTSEGTQSMPFWFEDGMLMVNYLELDTTLCFRKA